MSDSQILGGALPGCPQVYAHVNAFISYLKGTSNLPNFLIWRTESGAKRSVFFKDNLKNSVGRLIFPCICFKLFNNLRIGMTPWKMNFQIIYYQIQQQA